MALRGVAQHLNALCANYQRSELVPLVLSET